MKRIYKFRAWFYDQKKFDHDLDFEKIGKTYSKPLYWCEIQQFTGIKDRNGKEIYEGDIVNVNGGNHIVEWRGAGFAATWSDYNLDSCWFVGGGPIVIGNIFENPELAEKARKSPKPA